MSTIIDARLKGTRHNFFVREFFTNSAYFPIANIILELLLKDPIDYLGEPDPYFILFAAVVQAWLLSHWQYLERPQPLFGNLIGPLIYTVIELLLEGGDFTASANHVAYWGFSLVIGLSQQLRLWLSPRLASELLLLENLVRTSILLVMYLIIEFISDEYASFAEFLHDPPHLFVVITVPLIGLLTGFANSNAERNLMALRETATQLKEYSEWLLGKELLAQAVANPEALSLSRHERVMLFMDIRGFTAWSEREEPEQVVALMNAYYEAAEPVWRIHHALKVKFTADEIMLVFAGVDEAMAASQALRTSVLSLLQLHGLSAGIGLHGGPVVEGLMGAPGRKGYDLLGDSVNTAKRLCDNALGGEILVSQELLLLMGATAPQGQLRSITAKGKQEPISAVAID